MDLLCCSGIKSWSIGSDYLIIRVHSSLKRACILKNQLRHPSRMSEPSAPALRCDGRGMVCCDCKLLVQYATGSDMLTASRASHEVCLGFEQLHIEGTERKGKSKEEILHVVAQIACSSTE